GEAYDLRARRRAEEDDRFGGFWGRSRSEEVRARAGSTGVEIAYQTEASITFQVIDAADRDNPVVTSEVYFIRNVLKSAIANADGRTTTG
ncbi:MAG: hypothetical protein ABFS30_15630, partial [Pseudomonadota bacterium]